ncbi:unnamed protein product [Lupinus luteus]|uniref:Uncharacterized protein n=1 Tax=Lupinus luteus TaxID=3873 RepID=A0AAV1XIS4_LUPLU
MKGSGSQSGSVPRKPFQRGFKGTPFTQYNVRPGEANVRIRLDRALPMAEWRLLFPQAQRKFSMILGQITALLSERRLIILSAIMDRGHGGSSF